jgi:hypothetical protein
VNVSIKTAVKDPEPDYKCLEKEAGKIEQNKAVFGR